MRPDFLVHDRPVSLDQLAAAEEPYSRAYWLRHDLFAAQHGRPIPSYLSVVPPREPWWRGLERTPCFDLLVILGFVICVVALVYLAGWRIKVGP